MASIIEEQYYLSKKANISLIESEFLTEYDRQAFLDLIAQDMKNEIPSI